MMSPGAVVQAQLDAFNARDLDALLATYAPDAQQYVLHGALLAQGHEVLRTRYAIRFAEPDLHARLWLPVADAGVAVQGQRQRPGPAGRLGWRTQCPPGRGRAAAGAAGDPRTEVNAVRFMR